MSGRQQQEPREQSGYLPPGMIPLAFTGFAGLNTKSPRAGIEDQQCSWMDGFMPLGKNNARTLPDIGTSIFDAGGTGAGNTVVWFDFFNIGTSPYAVVLISDGSLWYANTNTLLAYAMAGPGTVENPSIGNIGCTQWGNSYLIIVCNQTNGIFAWDGTVFYTPGGTSVPNLQGALPTGLGGTSIETYLSRTWIDNGNLCTFSAPGDFTDYSSGDGSGTFTSTDSFLRTSFIQPKQLNGFLYHVADSSVNYISGVVTSGDPPATTFSNLNADAENGTPWAEAIEIFGQAFAFANTWGAHLCNGGAVRKMSEPVDVLWTSLPNFGGGRISSAKAIIFGVRVLMYLVPVIDTYTGQQTNKLIMTDGRQWWTSQQGVSLSYIATQEINSVQTAYGTDGTNIYPLFQQPSTNFEKVIQSKLFAMPDSVLTLKAASRLWAIAQFNDSAGNSLDITIDSENGASAQTVVAGLGPVTWINSGNAVATWTNSASEIATWTGNGPQTGIYVMPPLAVTQWGALMGMTIETTAADMSLITAVIGTEEQSYRG